MYLVCIMYISIPVATIFGTVWISPYCMDIIFPHPGCPLSFYQCCLKGTFDNTAYYPRTEYDPSFSEI